MSCSPAFLNVVVNVATNPGMSITFALVVPTMNPCTTSVAVPRKVTGMPAGTTMHCGSNEYCWAMSRTITLPSALSAVPRFDSTNSPDTCSVRGSIVSTREGGIDAQWMPVTIIIKTRTAMMIPTTIAQRRSAATATCSAVTARPLAADI
jgi:hypothetical protein